MPALTGDCLRITRRTFSSYSKCGVQRDQVPPVYEARQDNLEYHATPHVSQTGQEEENDTRRFVFSCCDALHGCLIYTDMLPNIPYGNLVSLRPMASHRTPNDRNADVFIFRCSHENIPRGLVSNRHRARRCLVPLDNHQRSALSITGLCGNNFPLLTRDWIGGLQPIEPHMPHLVKDKRHFYCVQVFADIFRTITTRVKYSGLTHVYALERPQTRFVLKRPVLIIYVTK